MSLSPVQLKVDYWSKCVLMGATLLFVYSLVVFGISSHMPHHHEHHHQFGGGHHHHHEQDGACRIRHFAILGLITSVTGMMSAFRMTRGFAVMFMILVLLTEIVALSLIGWSNAKAVRDCQRVSTTESIAVQQTDIKLSNGAEYRSEKIIGASINVDQPLLHHCLDGVRHAAVLSSLIVGVVACSLACCSSRFSNALVERDVEDMHGAAIHAVAVMNSTASAQQMEDGAPVLAVVVSSNPDAKCEPSPQLV